MKMLDGNSGRSVNILLATDPQPSVDSDDVSDR